MREFIEDNRKHWEELARLHPDTDFYDVEAFLDGNSTLDPVEPDEIGPVKDQSLLHLQCHFGLDTLSWARRGAEVTGVDISRVAIDTARELAETIELDHQSRFVCSDVYDLTEHASLADAQFDIVYTSFGALWWLPDLERWGDVVAHFVKDGGRFYLIEHHPFTGPLSWESTPDHLAFGHPYFHERISSDATETGSYAGIGPGDLEHGPTHGWAHSLGAIVSAIAQTGLRIEFLHEYPWSTFTAVEAMEERENGRYVLPGVEFELPFVFSLRATR